MIVEWTGRFRRAYQRLQESEQDRLDKALRLLVPNAKRPWLHAKRVQGTEAIWEARSSLKIRFTFERIPDGIRLRNIDDHDACLKNP